MLKHKNLPSSSYTKMASAISPNHVVSSNAVTETSPLLGDPISHTENDIVNDHEDDQQLPASKPHPMASKMHLILPAIGIGIYLGALDQLLTVATYARIGSELHALNNTSWIATAYFLTLTSFQPLYGKLSDIFGRKECLLFAYAVFGLGCLGCGLAQSMVQLCVARAVAGIGGGGMNAVVAIVMSDIVPLRERGVWQGYINLIYAFGTATGAPVGGLMADSLGWRWSFIAQTPICAMAALAVYFILDLPPVTHDHWLAKIRRIDFLGAFTLILAVIALLAGLDSGSNLGWSHIITLVSLGLAPVLFAAFLLVEIKIAKDPFAPGRIIFDRSLFACFLANFFSSASQLSIMFFLPLFFQAVHGYNATRSGSVLVAPVLAGVSASLGSGWIMKKTGRYYRLTIWSYALSFAAMAPLLIALAGRSLIGEMTAFVLSSIGGGSGVTTTLVGLLANAETEDTAVVIACSYLFRSLGSSIGISVGSAVLQQVLKTQLAIRLPNGDEARQIEEKVRQSLDAIKQLPPGIAEQVRASYQVATMGAFVPSVLFAGTCFLVSFWIKEKSLKK